MGNITQKWVTLLMPFSSDYSGGYSATEISKKTKIPQQTASRELNKMAENNIINYKIKGKNKIFYFDQKKPTSKMMMNMIENQKSVEFLLGQKKVSVIINELIGLCKSIILFGSYAAGNETKKSDLDIVLLGCDKKIDNIKRKFPIEINEHFVSYKEFEKILKNKNPLANEIAANHVLFGDISNIVDILWGWNYEIKTR